jgi:glycosyltransferase involved in cell wall biosynthesis
MSDKRTMVQDSSTVSPARPRSSPRVTGAPGELQQRTGLVSVVIPTYNYARFLGDAIRSVLDQTYPSVEIIVVDDGSTDDPAAIVAKFEAVEFIAQQNQGLSAARNAGLRACRGELVVFLDADDRLLPDALATGARLLADNPSLGFAAGYSRLISVDGVPQATVNRPVSREHEPYVALLSRNSIRNPAAVVFRRDIVDAVGGFVSGVDACADLELYLRITRSFPVVFHEVTVAEYRRHGENMSDNAAVMLRQALEVLRQQRPYLVTAARRRALRDGTRSIREYFGDLLVEQIRARVRSRSEWWRMLQDVAVLSRFDPAAVLQHAGRKLRALWRRADAPESAA